MEENKKSEVVIDEVQKPAFTKYYDKQDAYNNLDRVIGWVNNCDTKASILIAFIAAIIAIFAQGFANISFLVEIFKMESTNAWHWIKFSIIALCLIAFVALLIFLVINIWKVLKAKIIYAEYKAKYLANKESQNNNMSIMFFQTIAVRSLEDFKERQKSLAEEDFFDDISEQIHINSKRVTEKFKHYNRALLLSILLFGISLAFLVISFI